MRHERGENLRSLASEWRPRPSISATAPLGRLSARRKEDGHSSRIVTTPPWLHRRLDVAWVRKNWSLSALAGN